MQGIIQQKELVIVPDGYPDSKPVVYEDVPLFDQTTHYVIQQAQVDAGSHIFMGIEVRGMEITENPEMF